jgi:hypothetical protein
MPDTTTCHPEGKRFDTLDQVCPNRLKSGVSILISKFKITVFMEAFAGNQEFFYL